MGTTADKLQRLVEGKQAIVDAVNSKANTSLSINSKLSDVASAIDDITIGEKAVVLTNEKIGKEIVSDPSTYVEKIYFNTDLSVDEVIDIYEKAKPTTETRSGILSEGTFYCYTLFGDSDTTASCENLLMICKHTSQGYYMIANVRKGIKYFTSKNNEGWIEGVENPATINKYGVAYDPYTTGYLVNPNGENKNFVKIFSMNEDFTRVEKELKGEYDGTPITTSESVDMEALLDEGKLPLKINVESSGTNTSDATATANDILLGKTAYTADGKVVGTIEEYDGESDVGAVRSLKKLLDYTKSTNNLFNGNITITDLNGYMNYNDTENVITMVSMFKGASYLSSIPLLNTSKVTTMQETFYGCKNLKSLPQMDTSNVKNMYATFTNCNALTTIPQMDTSNVTTMYSMFTNCEKLTTIPQMDTSNVTTMQSMFSGCKVLTAIPQLDTSKVTNTSSMFNGCSALITIQLSDLRNNLDMSRMFYNCKSLIEIPSLQFHISTSPSTFKCENMFYGCSKLKKIGYIDTKKVTEFQSMFSNCTELTDVPLIDMSRASQMGSMFYGCNSIKKIEISNFYGRSNYATNMFNGCKSLKALVIRSNLNTSIQANSFTDCYRLSGTIDATYNPDGLKDGYIYVPRDKVDTFKSATNWSAFADQIRALEDYTLDGTTTGELDLVKMGLEE